MSTVHAGVLFCVGGRGGSGDPFRSIECYSISKNSWFFGPEMNSRRRHVGVISVEGETGRRAGRLTMREGERWGKGQMERQGMRDGDRMRDKG